MKVKNKFILAVTGCVCAVALITAGAFSFLSSASSDSADGAVGVFNARSELYLSNPDAGNIGKNLEKMNPGDVHDINLFVSNEGNKSLAYMFTWATIKQAQLKKPCLPRIIPKR